MVSDSNQKASRPLAMIISEKNKRRIWWICACLLPLLYFFLYASYGFEDKDTGFILGNSWQVLGGSKLYSDIIYIRPPVSVLFHLLPFCAPDNHVLILDRFLFYLEVFGYSVLAVRLLGRAFQIHDSRHLAFITALSFVISVHNFPPMAWHTVDGIFFCTLGLALIIGAKQQVSSRTFLGGTVLALGVLCKQSFYLMPFGLIFYLLINKQRSKLICTLAGLVLVCVLFGIWLIRNGTMHGFIELTSGQTTLSDLFKIGIHSYIKEMDKLPLFFGPPLVAAILAARYAKKYAGAICFFVLFGWVLAHSLGAYIQSATFTPPPGNFPNVLFIGVFLYIFWKYIREKADRYLLSLVFLLLAWSASISWGYSSVVLFSAPIVFVIGLLLRDSFSFTHVKLAATVLFLLSIATFWAGYQHPYTLDQRGLHRKEMHYDMGLVYSRLTGIHADRNTYEQYVELKDMVQRYGDSFTILPSCTLAHFITDTRNPIGADWVLNAEINERSDLLIQRLERHCPVVFVERRKISSEGKWGSSVTTHVMKEWQKAEEGRYFDVYKYISEPVECREAQFRGVVP